MRFLPSVLLLAMLVLAGCSSPQAVVSSTSTTATAPTTAQGSTGEVASKPIVAGETVEHIWKNGTIQANAIVADATPNGFFEFVIPVTNHTTLITFNLTWTSPGNAQDINPFIAYPGCSSLSPPNGCTTNWFSAGIAPDGAAINSAGGPGAPDSPASLVLDAKQISDHAACNGSGKSECSWWAGIVGNQVIVETTYSMHIEIHDAASSS